MCTDQYRVFNAGVLLLALVPYISSAVETSNNNLCQAEMVIAQHEMKGLNLELRQLLNLTHLFDQQKQLTG